MKNDSASYKDDLALAHVLADLADSIALQRYQALDLVVTTKPDNTPVTDADRAVETAIREALAMPTTTSCVESAATSTSAIKQAHVGTPRIKFLVPSIGSITQ